MKIAFVGDIVGKPGRDIIGKYLKDIRNKYNIDLVIANYENASHGFGLTKKNADELLGYGIDIMTGGNHSWDKKEIFDMFNSYPLIRPINYPEKSAGKGWIELKVCGERVVIVNVMGSYTMPMSDNPFIKMDNIITKLKDDGINHIIVDMHGEATSEKQVMMHLLKDRISALLGTHTHVGTDDLTIVDGCCYITDVGLTGCRDQVIGVDKKIPMQRFLTGIGGHFHIPKECKKILQVVIFDLDSSGRAIDSKKIKLYDTGESVILEGRIEKY